MMYNFYLLIEHPEQEIKEKEKEAPFVSLSELKWSLEVWRFLKCCTAASQTNNDRAKK